MYSEIIKQKSIDLYAASFCEGNKEEAEIFVSSFFKDVEMILDNNEIVSQLFLIDAVYSGNTPSKFKYIYAASTNVKYRNKGYMNQLLCRCIEKVKSMGYDGIYLYPANRKLREYYKKIGFSDCFGFSKTMRKTEIIKDNPSITPCDEFISFCRQIGTNDFDKNSTRIPGGENRVMAVIFNNSIDKNAFLKIIGD